MLPGEKSSSKAQISRPGTAGEPNAECAYRAEGHLHGFLLGIASSDIAMGAVQGHAVPQGLVALPQNSCSFSGNGLMPTAQNMAWSLLFATWLVVPC